MMIITGQRRSNVLGHSGYHRCRDEIPRPQRRPLLVVPRASRLQHADRPVGHEELRRWLALADVELASWMGAQEQRLKRGLVPVGGPASDVHRRQEVQGLGDQDLGLVGYDAASQR